MSGYALFLSLLVSFNSYAQPTPETAAECAKEMIGRQVGNASPVGGCALNLATKLRILSRMAHDGSRTEANLVNEISSGFTSCYPAVPGASAAANRFIATIGEIDDVNSTTFGGSSCLGDMWADIDARMAGTNPSGRVVADPHITTLDGLYYNFQGEGIFTNFTNKANDFVAQGLYKKLKSTNNGKVKATHAEAFAFKIGKNVINISIHSPNLYVNGSPQSLNTMVILNDGLTITKTLKRLEIQSGTGDQIVVVVHSTFLDVFFKLSPLRIGTFEGGLLGNYNLNREDDITTKDGVIIDAKDINHNSKLYTEFGDSHRVAEKESLFCESILSTYKPFDRLFPLNIDNPPVDESAVLLAKQVCEKKEIKEEPFLEDCIHDVVAAKDNTFVESASMAQTFKNNPEMIFKQYRLGDGFNGQYELEFTVQKTGTQATVNYLNISTRVDDSAIEYRVDGMAKYRVVTDYLSNKITNINFQNNAKLGFRRKSESILEMGLSLPIKWTKTNETKKILGYEATLYSFTLNTTKGEAWVATKLKHNHVLPFKFLTGLFRNETFSDLLFPNYLFAYNYYGMILEVKIDDKNGLRLLKVKSIKTTPDAEMLDLSDVVIKDI